MFFCLKFIKHHVLSLSSMNLLNNDSSLFKHESDPKSAANKSCDPGWFSQFLTAAPSTSSCWARPLPC